MAIGDPDPNRRNLVLTSVAFILFYLGCGKPVDGEVKIIFVNIEFQNTEFLAVFSWLMLIWFFIRFRQTRGDGFMDSFRKDINDVRNNKILIQHMEKKLEIPFSPEGGFIITSARYDNHGLEIYYNKMRDLNKDKVGLNNDYKRVYPGDQLFDLSGTYKLIITIAIVVSACLNRTGFAEQLLPYLLFYFAVLLGVGDILLSSIDGIRLWR